MALGTTIAVKSDSIFVDLKTSAQKGKESVGFRQETGQTTDESGKVVRSYQMHDYVSGHILSFKVNEQPTYDDKSKSEWIGYLTLSDKGQPNIVVRFPLERYSGRRLVGLINAAHARGEETIFLRTTFAAAGTKLGDSVTETAQAFLTMRAGDAQGEKIVPVYSDANGNLLLDANGQPVPLPKAEIVKVGRQEVKDSSAADNIVLETAANLVAHFEAAREARKQAQGQGQGQGHGDEDGINPDEAAAAAAAPRG